MDTTATLVGMPLPTQTQTQTLTQARTQAQNQDETPADEHETILGDLSFAQVIATAMAGAASFALSNQIGVAGSLIGAAIGTVVTVVCSQVFKQIIKKSAHKLESLVQHGGEEQCADKTGILFLSKANKLQRRWQIAVCLIACGICSVFLYAAIVNVATNGEGIGTKPEADYALAEQEDQAEEATAAMPATNAWEGVESPEQTPAQTTDATVAPTTEATDTPSDILTDEPASEPDSPPDRLPDSQETPTEAEDIAETPDDDATADSEAIEPEA